MFLDVFNNSAFSTVSLTAAIAKAPYAPSRVGSMGLFAQKGITTLDAAIEEENGKLSIIQTSARGTHVNQWSGNGRKVRSFRVPHVQLDAAVMAADVIGVRAFGSEDQVEAVQGVVAGKLAALRQQHEVTHEYHRIGAVKGIVLDADGSEVYNWFDEFGITQDVVNFDFSDAGLSIKSKSLDIWRLIEDALGATVFTGVHCFCGNAFFDNLVTHPDVKAAFDRWQDGQFLREGQTQRKGFMFADITWENYRGAVGATKFVDDNEAHFFPTGVLGLFDHVMAPADFIEAVGTKGQLIYVKQERMKFDQGVELHSQSNPLLICTRPKTLIKGVETGSTS